MLSDTFKNIKNNTLARYIIIGGTSYIFEFTLLFFIAYTLNLGVTVAVTISFWFGLIISFLLQKFFSFKDTTVTKKHLLRQTFSYAILIIVNYSFTIFFVVLVEPISTLFIARTAALIITVGWNYIIYSRVIFKMPR